MCSPTGRTWYSFYSSRANAGQQLDWSRPIIRKSLRQQQSRCSSGNKGINETLKSLLEAIHQPWIHSCKWISVMISLTFASRLISVNCPVVLVHRGFDFSWGSKGLVVQLWCSTNWTPTMSWDEHFQPCRLCPYRQPILHFIRFTQVWRKPHQRTEYTVLQGDIRLAVNLSHETHVVDFCTSIRRWSGKTTLAVTWPLIYIFQWQH